MTYLSRGLLLNMILQNPLPIGRCREMAVGLDEIQTELADLDIEVDPQCKTEKLPSKHSLKIANCWKMHIFWLILISGVKVTDEAVLGQLAQLCQRYGIDAEKISCEYFSFANNTKATIMGKLLRGRLLHSDCYVALHLTLLARSAHFGGPCTF